MTTHTDPNQKRLREQASRIRLVWAGAGHPTTNLVMHSAFRSLGIPRAERPRNVNRLRAMFRDYLAQKELAQIRGAV